MKFYRRQIIAGGGASAVLVLSGCGGVPQTSYRLIAVPGTLRGAGHLSVSVRSVIVPGYMDQNNIIKPGGTYEVNSFDDAVWAEPFADMLQAALVEDLAQRLPEASLFSDGAIGEPADIVVEADVQRFDFDPDGQINLTAQFGIKSNGAGPVWRTSKFHAVAAPQALQASAVVAAMSDLWGQAADQLASMIA